MNPWRRAEGEAMRIQTVVAVLAGWLVKVPVRGSAALADY